MLQCRLAAEDGGAKQVYGGIDQDTCFHARSDSGAVQLFAPVRHSILMRMSVLMSCMSKELDRMLVHLRQEPVHDWL